MNPAYIQSAKTRWKDRANCSFTCQEVKDAEVLNKGGYDIVLALAILHHLNDEDAVHLFDMAHEALTPEGALITYDNVYVHNQNPIARWLISRDRGRAVRTEQGYLELAKAYFVHVESEVLHDTLRLPYTIHVMRCAKGVSIEPGR